MIKQLDTTIAELSPELKAMVADASDALISADRALKSADNALGPDSPDAAGLASHDAGVFTRSPIVPEPR